MTTPCSDARGGLDSYLCDELPVDERATVEGHLAACPACAAELERRQRVRHELASALAVGNVRPLESRILGIIAAERRRRRAVTWGAAAAAAVLALAIIRFSGPQDASLYAETQDAHRICAVQGHYPSPQRPELAAARLGRYAALWAATEPELADATLLSAHVCPHGARSYGHVILRRGAHLVSVLATADRPAPLPRAGLGREPEGIHFAAAGGETYAAFVLSDLDSSDHSALSDRLLPRILNAFAGRAGQ